MPIPARLKHVGLLLELMHEYYVHDRLPFDRDCARDALLGLLHNRDWGGIWMISAAPAELVGYVAVTYGYSLEYGGRDAFVDELYIRAAHWRRGLGRACLRFVASACVARGIKSLHLVVEARNQDAQAFCHVQGFAGRGRTLNTLKLGPH